MGNRNRGAGQRGARSCSAVLPYNSSIFVALGRRLAVARVVCGERIEKNCVLGVPSGALFSFPRV